MSIFDVLQEGWFYFLTNLNNSSLTISSSNKQYNNHLIECKYQILSNGILIYCLNYENILQINILTLNFRLFDCSSYILTGYGLILLYEENEYFIIFNHIIDIKRFCLCCYRLGNNNLMVFSFIYILFFIVIIITLILFLNFISL